MCGQIQQHAGESDILQVEVSTIKVNFVNMENSNIMLQEEVLALNKKVLVVQGRHQTIQLTSQVFLPTPFKWRPFAKVSKNFLVKEELLIRV